jgi:hypothetical protein
MLRTFRHGSPRPPPPTWVMIGGVWRGERHGSSAPGVRLCMDDRERPTTNQPLNAPGPRPKVTPVLAVIGLVLLIAAIFLVISLLRYNT